MRRSLRGNGSNTVIASESCFARGVDHCLVSDDDHLTREHGDLLFHLELLLTALRKQVRA
jgi:phosphoribosyl-ATP pyrophosphohydrolase